MQCVSDFFIKPCFTSRLMPNIYFARPRLRFSSGRFLPIAALLKQLRS